jgi:hypothetical protein
MSPALKQDCIRAVSGLIAPLLLPVMLGPQVLTWRQHPQDLDLHCLTSNCHVCVPSLEQRVVCAQWV